MENKVLAKVDGREINDSDLNNLTKNLGQNAAYFQGADGRKKLLEELIMQELMYSDALKRNLENDEEFIAVMEGVKKTMLQQYRLRKMFDGITVSEEDIQNYYEKHKAQFVTDETVQASHILVDSEEAANEVLEKIADGVPFEDAAVQYSSCPSKQAGGDLGRFGKGQMVKEFEDAVFSMEIGEISKPVKTQFGYHIIKLTGHTPKKDTSLKEAYQQVKDACFMEKQDKAFSETRAKLGSMYSIEIFE